MESLIIIGLIALVTLILWFIEKRRDESLLKPDRDMLIKEVELLKQLVARNKNRNRKEDK
jgi:hypothetical protein